MTNSDNLATHEMLEPAPVVTIAELEAIAREYFGRQVAAKLLTSERDCNALLTELQTNERTLLKLANPSEPIGVTQLQIDALLHINATDPDCPTPHMLPAVDGSFCVRVDLNGGRSYVARLLTFISGRPMAGTPLSIKSAASKGSLLARVDLALEAFSHSDDTRSLIWDISRADRLLEMTVHIVDPNLRQLAERSLNFAAKGLDDLMTNLRRQVIHSDFNPHNIIVDQLDTSRVVGVIDFGDIIRAPLICDVAIASSYMMDGSVESEERVVALVSAYSSVLPLLHDEVEILPDLIAARLAMTATIPSWRAKLFPANAEYIQRNLPRAASALCSFDETAQRHLRERLLKTCPESGLMSISANDKGI
jgi:hydroxylysine kinase